MTNAADSFPPSPAARPAHLHLVAPDPQAKRRELAARELAKGCPACRSKALAVLPPGCAIRRSSRGLCRVRYRCGGEFQLDAEGDVMAARACPEPSRAAALFLNASTIESAFDLSPGVLPRPA